MNDPALQVMLIFAYLAIALISVTLPIFAICVVYLRQEKREAEGERKRKVEHSRQKLTYLSNQLGEHKKEDQHFRELQKEITKCQNELEQVESRVESLTARGAVGRPVILLFFALVAAGVGIYYSYQEVALWASEGIFICALGSGFFSSFAVYSLYRTLENIERASLRTTHEVQFLVQFGVLGKKTEEIPSGRDVQIKLGASTDEEDLERQVILFYFRPDIKVRLVGEDAVMGTVEQGFPYQGFTCVTISNEFVHKGTSNLVPVIITVEKKGIYKIPVRVEARGIEPYLEELELRVI
jgi:hypothetical protein